MKLTKKEWWIIGLTIFASVTGSYIFYRKQNASDNSLAENIQQNTTQPTIANDLSVVQANTITNATETQAQNVISSLGANYTNYNVSSVVDLNTGASVGNGNSFTRGISGQQLYDSQLQMLVASNPLLAPTATATQSPQEFIDWRTVFNPPLPN